MSAVASETWRIPADDPPSYPLAVGRSLKLGYGVYGRMPERTGVDMQRSLKRWVAMHLDAHGAAFLDGTDFDGHPASADSWEVRLWDEEGAFRFPFARVARVGPEVDSAQHPIHMQLTQPVTIQLYPFPSTTREEAEIRASSCSTLIADGLKWGSPAAQSRELAVPLFDYGGKALHEPAGGRHPSDYFRVIDLQTDRLPDPEDERAVAGIVSFRAQWRRVPSDVPGHLVESVRITTHPS